MKNLSHALSVDRARALSLAVALLAFLLLALAFVPALTPPPAALAAHALDSSTNTPTETLTLTPTVTNTPTNTPTPTPLATAYPFLQGLPVVEHLLCGYYRISGYSPGDCVQMWGGQIHAYNKDTGANTLWIDAATGDITTTGTINAGGIGGVSTVTPVATATPITALNALAVRTPGALSVAGTPVIPFATPQTLLLNNETAGQFITCSNIAVTGSATFTPVPGQTPIMQPVVSLQTVSGDAAHVAGDYSAGTFTLSVFDTALTPAPNTTPVNVEVCYFYTK